jgi:hypothetical protein
VGAQAAEVDPRLVPHAVEDPVGDELTEVAVPPVVLDEDHQLPPPLLAVGVLEAESLGLQVELGTEDRLDLGALARFVEGDGAVQVGRVRERQVREAEFLGARHQGVDGGGAVEDRELGVDVEVHERHGVPA